MPISSKLSGTWDTVDAVYAKIGGSWKTVSNGYTKVSGQWKEFYSAFSAPLDIFVVAGGQSAPTFTSGNGGGITRSAGEYEIKSGYKFSVVVGGANSQSLIRSLNSNSANTGGTYIEVTANSDATTTTYTENGVATSYSKGSASRVSSVTYTGYSSGGVARTRTSSDYQVLVSPTIPSAGAGANGGTYSLDWSVNVTTCGTINGIFRCGLRGLRTTSGTLSGGAGRTSFSGDEVGFGRSSMYYVVYDTVDTWTDSTSRLSFGNYSSASNAAANSGGGGRGSAEPSGGTTGTGGSGRVEIRYPDIYPTLTNPGTGILTTAGGFHTYRFNSSTSITV